MQVTDPIIFGVGRTWLGVTSKLFHRSIRKCTNSTMSYAKKFEKLRDPEIEKYLEELRFRIPKQFSNKQNTQPNQINVIPLGYQSQHLSLRKKSLLQTSQDYKLACEALGLASVIMERTLGIRPHPNQITAAFALAQGWVIQLDTGEGKTFVGGLRAFLDHLWGLRTTIVTPNTFLAARDAQWLSPFYEQVTLKGVGCADQDPDAYYKDVCYVSLSNLMFNHVSHITCYNIENWVDPDLESVIIDEIDAVLLDTGSFGHAVKLDSKLGVYKEAQLLAQQLHFESHYQINQTNQKTSLTTAGYQFLEEKRSVFPSLIDISQPAFQFHIRCALQALHVYQCDKHYIIADDKRIVVIDHNTGRQVPGRSFGLGIQQALEVKEGLPISLAEKCIYSVFPETVIGQAVYTCGMSGSAASERITFRLLYGLPVIVIPPNQPSGRRVRNDEVFVNQKQQFRRVIELTRNYNTAGQPVLIGTQSIQDAEEISLQLIQAGLPTKTITAKNDFEEAEILKRAGKARAITVAARMAGRGVDIVTDRQANKAGGLAVIGLGRFLIRRLDEQLVGRTGRQGEGGDVHFILSFEDDLFKTVPALGAIQNLVASISKNQPIESSMLSRSLKGQQLKISDHNFIRLSNQLRCNRLLTPIRISYERRRLFLLASENLDSFIEEIINSVLTKSSTEFIKSLMGSTTRQEISVSALWSEYQERKLVAGPVGSERERQILLKCLDFQWAILYLDWMRHLGTTSFKHNLLFHKAKFLTDRQESFEREFLEQAIYYLLYVNYADVLQQCYYWKGILLPATIAKGNEQSPSQLGGISIPRDQTFPQEFKPVSSRSSNSFIWEKLPNWLASLKDLMGPENESSYRSEFRVQRLRESYMALILAILGLTIIGLPQILNTQSQVTPYIYTPFETRPLILSFANEFNRMIFMHGLNISLGLAICLLMMVLYKFLSSKISNLGYLILMLSIGIISLPLVQQSPRSHIGTIFSYAISYAISIWALSASGLNFIEGLTFISGVLSLTVFWPYPNELENIFLVLAVISWFAFATFLTAKQFKVQSFRGWHHREGSQKILHHTYVVDILDNIMTLFLARIWSSLIRFE